MEEYKGLRQVQGEKDERIDFIERKKEKKKRIKIEIENERRIGEKGVGKKERD